MIEKTLAHKALGKSLTSESLEKDLNLYWEDFTDDLEFKKVASISEKEDVPITSIGKIGGTYAT